MAGSEKAVWWDFKCDFPEWRNPRQQSICVNKHDGEGFPKLSNPLTRLETVQKIADLLGIKPESISWWSSPWGIDDLVISERPKKTTFDSIGEASELSCKLYQLCQFTREEHIKLWAEAKERIKQKQQERRKK